ncbi:hypothetical protein EV138_5004 [Kribbella voronezhensis]|uniref:Uncharacterized protein n=1 Tax=Kribbella voronezhensis TaxID=2512212 RepID=A0A4R7TIH6_9ACTN|nr:hypothetical protein [Kribbella voronezhensis]TDU91398.1 hypothetical protein EV138_5004 [Kribbella voronezhensis]
MPSQKGRELPASSPEYQWVASVIRSVEQRTGSPTRWNKQVFEELDPGVLGSAHADGAMTVSPGRVLDPVRHAYTGGRPLTNDENYRLRDAAATVTHEAVHLSSHYGDPTVPGAHPTHDPAGRALEEGQAEHWTHRNLDGVIADVGLDRAAPGVLTQPSMDAYPAYTSASADLNSALAARTGQSTDEIATRLIGTERTQRWNEAADMVIDQRLGGLMPESHRDAVRAQVVAPARAEFEKLATAQADKSLNSAQKTMLARDAASRAISGMDQAVGHAEQHYQNWYQQEAARQAPQQTAQQSATPQGQQTTPQQAGSQQAQQTGPQQAGSQQAQQAGQQAGPQQAQQSGPQQAQQTAPQQGQHSAPQQGQQAGPQQGQQSSPQQGSPGGEPRPEPVQQGQAQATNQQTTPSTGQAASPEVAKLRAMMSGQAPASGAVHVNGNSTDGARADRNGQSAGQQATRTTKTPTPERG